MESGSLENSTGIEVTTFQTNQSGQSEKGQEINGTAPHPPGSNSPSLPSGVVHIPKSHSNPDLANTPMDGRGHVKV